MLEETAAESTPEADCRVPADAAPAMYVGWSIWQEFGYGDDSEAAEIPEQIKADVGALAEALVKHSATFDEDVGGFPPEDLGLPPGTAPLDNELARFDFAVNSIGREARTLERLDAWAGENCARSR